MLEPAVVSPGVNKACQAQLLDIPQTLEPGVFNDIINQIARNADKPINRIIDNFPFICPVDQLKKINLQK
jgi:hypothetical protein